MQTPMPPNSTKRILCVDDDTAVLNVTRELLQWKGYEVETANCGVHAVEQLGRPFDLLIVDYNLPDFNGDVVAERFKKLQPSTPVLMLSGSSEVPESALAHVNAYLVKGSGVASLFGAISALTESVQ